MSLQHNATHTAKHKFGRPLQQSTTYNTTCYNAIRHITTFCQTRLRSLIFSPEQRATTHSIIQHTVSCCFRLQPIQHTLYSGCNMLPQIAAYHNVLRHTASGKTTRKSEWKPQNTRKILTYAIHGFTSHARTRTHTLRLPSPAPSCKR